MPSLRLATFNCENLMMRCDFRKSGISEARTRLTAINTAEMADQVDAVFDVLSEDDRTLTAQALVETRADVCAVQEVENLVTLTAFDNRYVARWAGRPFGERVLFEGNDQRGIDVGLLSRLPVARKTSHAHETYASLGIPAPKGVSPHDRAFRRDCLEVDVVKDGRALTLFVCHFKSMHGGRAETKAIREGEANAVKQLIARRFDDPASAEWVILGDLNDYTEIDGTPLHDHGLAPLLDDGFAIDLLLGVEPDPLQRWTHHYGGGNVYGALDHILLSPRLAAANPAPKTKIVRVGAPFRATRFAGFRLPGIGWASPKASDHCPLAATLVFEGRALSA